MFADSTNTALCRCSLLFVFISSSVQIPFDGCPEIHMHHPSHLRMKPQPLENNQTHCRANYHTRKRKERRRKKNTQRRDSHTGTSVIHQHDQDFRTLDLSAKLHQMTEDNSSWFGNLLVSSVFFSANDARLSRGNDSSNQKRLLPVKSSRTLIACFVSVSACNYI